MSSPCVLRVLPLSLSRRRLLIHCYRLCFYSGINKLYNLECPGNIVWHSCISFDINNFYSWYSIIKFLTIQLNQYFLAENSGVFFVHMTILDSTLIPRCRISKAQPSGPYTVIFSTCIHDGRWRCWLYTEVHHQLRYTRVIITIS